ncbi:MAG: hypothetical protein ABEI99_02500 [Halobaculum sp.]
MVVAILPRNNGIEKSRNRRRVSAPPSARHRARTPCVRRSHHTESDECHRHQHARRDEREVVEEQDADHGDDELREREPDPKGEVQRAHVFQPAEDAARGEHPDTRRQSEREHAEVRRELRATPGERGDRRSREVQPGTEHRRRPQQQHRRERDRHVPLGVRLRDREVATQPTPEPECEPKQEPLESPGDREQAVGTRREAVREDRRERECQHSLEDDTRYGDDRAVRYGFECVFEDSLGVGVVGRLRSAVRRVHSTVDRRFGV